MKHEHNFIDYSDHIFGERSKRRIGNNKYRGSGVLKLYRAIRHDRTTPFSLGFVEDFAKASSDWEKTRQRREDGGRVETAAELGWCGWWRMAAGATPVVEVAPMGRH
jgi:hypothetical protein